MGFFVSPATLLRLLKNRVNIADRLKARDKNWYFTKEGQEAYVSAEGVGAKCYHFYEYLKKLSNISGNSRALLRLAFVMAHTMVDSSLEFGGYPNVIDPQKNPLVACVQSGTLSSMEAVDGCCAALLAALHGEQSMAPYAEPRGHEKLSYCQDDALATDLYRIERDIITVFCSESKDTLPPPFLYDVVGANASEEDNHEELEDEEDEE